MPMKCTICKHPNRLDMERAYIQGKPVTQIAREYGVSDGSVSYHMKNHLSRQLVKSWELKHQDENMDLLQRIDQIINRAEKIFKRNYDKGKDSIALKALDNQRATFQLIAAISAKLHEIRLLELEQQKQEQGQEQDIRYQQWFADRLPILTDEESTVYAAIMKKLYDNDSDIDALKDVRLKPEPEKPKFTRRKQPVQDKETETEDEAMQRLGLDAPSDTAPTKARKGEHPDVTAARERRKNRKEFEPLPRNVQVSPNFDPRNPF